MDMGFNEAKVKRALESCPEAQTLEQVMEQLIAHEDELNSQAKNQSENKIPDKDSSEAIGNISSQAPETAANMAARKKITVQEAQQLINERQLKRAEEERKKAIEDEKRRRLDGQKILETKQELQDRERILLAQQIRREKLEKELHRKQVLEQIKMDRQKMAESRATSLAGQSSQKTPDLKTKLSDKSVSTSATGCNIAMRFPDGTSLVHKFSPQEQLSAVRLFVQMEKGSSLAKIEFFAPPNRKLTDADMDTSLEALGLCPASRLEVKLTQQDYTDLDQIIIKLLNLMNL